MTFFAFAFVNCAVALNDPNPTCSRRLSELRQHPFYRDLSRWEDFTSSNHGVIDFRQFKKDGSDIFLLGGVLAGNVIAKMMPKQAIENWIDLYNGYKNKWEAAGFDHVPIERPLSLSEVAELYKLPSHSIARLKYVSSLKTKYQDAVFSQVIHGVNFEELKKSKALSPEQIQALESKKRSILEILKLAGFVHGHTHDRNFVVEQNDSGPARIYLIDFDVLTKN